MPSPVTVVVGTLDLYKDVWPPFCHGLEKFWPDCPWPVRFITNNLDAPCGETIKVGGDRTGWSKRMRRGLEQVDSPVVLWLTSDNWITAPVNTVYLRDFAGRVFYKLADHIRLYPGWDHDTPMGDKATRAFMIDDRLWVFTKKSPYRCSLKPALWRRKVFMELLKDGEETWDFERFASKRSRRLGDRFMAVRDWGCFPFVTAGDPSEEWIKSPVVKGRWTEAARVYCDREGLKVDFLKHPVSQILDDKLRRVNWVLP